MLQIYQRTILIDKISPCPRMAAPETYSSVVYCQPGQRERALVAGMAKLAYNPNFASFSNVRVSLLLRFLIPTMLRYG